MLITLLIIGVYTLGSHGIDFPNIGYAGRGYDAIHGNPHTNGGDPGFKSIIVQHTYNGKKSNDGKLICPDKVDCLQKVICSYLGESMVTTGSKTYQNSLSITASVSGQGWGAKFSASAEFQNIRSGTDNFHKVYIETIAKCSSYHARVNRFDDFNVTSNFASAVADLPTTMDVNAYSKFVETFGTHYTDSVIMGSKYITRSEFDQVAWTRLEKDNIDVKAAASYSGFGLFGEFSTLTQVQKEQAQKFESRRTSMRIFYVGSRPTSDRKWETWAQNTHKTPYPIAYTMAPITELITSQRFNFLSRAKVSGVRNQLEQFYATYCNRIRNCGIPRNDNPTVKMDRLDVTVKGTHEVFCRPGYSLLSCGIQPHFIPTKSYEIFRKYWPSSLSSCTCYDFFGAQCRPWCTNAAKNLEIVRFTGLKTMGAFCPNGKKVVGCSVTPYAKQDDPFREHYPHSDGSHCICKDDYGAHCHAVCASNIINYEVRSEYKSGNFKVSCSPGNYVLGCGMKPSSRNKPEIYRAAFVSSIDSCECYDDFGMYCYAICGQFS